MNEKPRPTDRLGRRVSRLKRCAKWGAIALALTMALVAWAVYDDVRTLASLRRIEGSNAYVMDYYCDYHMDDIRAAGVDAHDVEGSLIAAYFPAPIEAIANRVRSWYVPKELEVAPQDGHHCSSVVFRGDDGGVYFGRNFDWENQAALVLRVHRAGVVESLSVIDLAYLNLDRADLESTALWERVPLLFAPYYVMDGSNRRGVAISMMSLNGAVAPYSSSKPDVLDATAMRLVLDYCATTQQAVELLGEYNLRFIGAPGHYMIADASGDTAVVEFVDGTMEITGPDRPWQVCTNSQLWGADEQQRRQQCDRYRRASEQLDAFAGEADAVHLMKVMESIAVDDWTMWSSVYSLSTDELLFQHRKPTSGGEAVRVTFTE